VTGAFLCLALAGQLINTQARAMAEANGPM
jgi:hypothetical protein